jgi:hypothetical protein
MTALPGIDVRNLAGNFPGYVLTFHTVRPGGELDVSRPLVLHSDLYEAELSLPMTGSLDASAATIVLSGLTDEHHRALAARTSAGGWERAVVRVHLFWRDANSTVTGYVANVLGLVALDPEVVLETSPASTGDPLRDIRIAELTVTGVSRRRGSRHYETVVTAVDRIAARTSVTLPEAVAKPLVDAATRLGELAGVTVDSTALRSLGRDGQLPFTAPRGARVSQAFGALAQRLELVTGKYGRGMLLVRDGTLVVGPRPVPYTPTPTPLNWGTGLLAVEAAAPIVTDTATNVEDDEPGGSAAGGTAAAGFAPGGLAVAAAGQTRRDQWTLTLRGRPDIKPGDAVTFATPAGEGTQARTAVALLGAFAAPLFGDDPAAATTRGYVAGVKHTLSRASGYLTVVTAVVLGANEDGWDRPATPATAAQARGTPVTQSAAQPDAGGKLSKAIERQIAERVATLELAEVGEVRAFHAAADTPQTQPQRLMLWQGTTPATDGKPTGAVRLPIERRTPLIKGDVPYATHFAWGKCGLVLPRYPGMRVLSVHRHGSPDEPIEIGALWSAGEGPNAHPGDYWLSLPVGVPESQRAQVDDSTVPTPHAGAVTNDLIDADGHRVISVANLRVRIGKPALDPAGHRPDPAPDDTLLSVEHSDGTTLLRIDSSGAVSVVAKGPLTLKGDGITLDAGGKDITMTAATVDVHVSNEMKVQ